MSSLAWLIPFLPLIGFLINGLGYRKIGNRPAGLIGCGSVLASFIIVSGLFIQSLSAQFELRITLYNWIVTSNTAINFSFYIDHLTLIMMLIVTGVGFLIHVYSVGYMKQDEGFGKFFAYLNLFIFFMLLLVMGANYVMMFIGWEGVGLCSYLLIGFWWRNREYSAAANKAFIMNRIGDLGFILGIFLMMLTFGSSDFEKVFPAAAGFAANDRVIVVITILLFIGAIGKSAQIPLFTWLPDAMAGPTPVSALIHAATMVTAGVYMIARSNLLYSLAPFTLTLITIIGTVTALVAALIALTQNDIKKVLAYSTVSQLGYMFVAQGVQAYDSGIFHLMTHAFFKALLFLGAGIVIHAMHHEQNIRKMGGLRKFMPVTYITFAIATLAISGFPPFAGFFSKDEILIHTLDASAVVFWILCFTSALTAAYMFRLFFLTFWGQFRGTHHQQEQLKESPRTMTIPLMILGGLSVVGGFLGLPSVFGEHHWLRNYLSPVFESNTRIIPEASHTAEYLLMAASVLVLLIIIWVAFNRYSKKKVALTLNEEKISIWYKLSLRKFYVDEIYQSAFVKPLEAVGDLFSGKIEKGIIDGAVNGVGQIGILLSNQLRRVQTGQTGFYVIAMVIGMILLLLAGLSKLNLL